MKHLNSAVMEWLPVVKNIDASDLRIGMYIHKLGGSWMQHPFLRSSFLLTEQNEIQRILDAGIKKVWIDEDKGRQAHSIEKPSVSVSRSNKRLPSAKSIKPKTFKRSCSNNSIEVDLERAKKLFGTAKEQVKFLFNDVRLGKAIDLNTTLELVDEIEASVQQNAAAIISVARLKNHDDYTYMHSVSVSVLMLAHAQQLGMEREQVKQAGMAGLLHDVGKAFMPLEILNKPGKLTDKEFSLIENHSITGAKVLQESGAEKPVIDTALHHHEKIDGFGYPHKLKADEIPIFARMGAICDVYDAVTSERVYKKPWCPAYSIREMARWQGHFDKSIFNAFVKSVGIYPLGSLVRLESQRLAVVVEPGTDSLLTPKVKAFFSLRLNAPIAIETIDLGANNCKDKIIAPEDSDNWNFKDLNRLWQ